MSVSHPIRTVLLASLLAAIALAAAGLLVSTASVLLIVFAGILFGIFLNAIIRRVPLSYRWSYPLVVILLVAIVAGGLYYMGARIADQISQLSGRLQTAGDALVTQLQDYDWLQRFLPEQQQMTDMVNNAGSRVLPRMIQGASSLAWGLTGLVVILFVGLYTAYEPELYAEGLVKLVPREKRLRARQLLDKLRSVLAQWIVGRIISMSIIGIFTAMGLWLLNVPLPITLGVLAAFLTFIPNIGPILATVPQALLALHVGAETVLYVILFNLALQFVESYLVTPIVQRYEVSLPPAVTIFVQLLLAVLVGLIGIVMAAPLTVSLMVIAQMLYIRDQLRDPEPGELLEDA